MYSKRIVFALWLVLCVSLAATSLRAFALSSTQIEAQIQGQIMQRHPTQNAAMTRNWWRALGTEAPGIMIAIYERSKNLHHRVRLLESLRHFEDSPEAVGYLRKVLDEAQTKPNGPESIIIQTALGGLGEAGKDARDPDILARFLKDNDIQTRLAAAKALKKMGSIESLALYDTYLKEEKTTWAVQRAKSEKVGVPLGIVGLSPVSSSEDAPHSQVFGQYRGLWVREATAGAGLITSVLKLNVKVGAEREPKVEAWAEVPVKGGKPGVTEARELTWSALKIKGTHLEAQVSVAGNVLPGPFTLEGDFVQKDGQWALELSANKLAQGWMIALKQVTE